MGIDEIKGSVGDLGDKLTQALSDEATSDAILDKAADTAKKATGGKFDDKIDQVRNIIDDKVGE